MSFLIDTNVLSELRKPHCDQNVRNWIDGVSSEECYVSVLSLGEIRRGIDLIRSKERMRALALEKWLQAMKDHYSDRLLEVDLDIALIWGTMSVKNNVSTIDLLMGATAYYHGLTLVTRNTSDFKSCGVPLLNPFLLNS